MTNLHTLLLRLDRKKIFMSNKGFSAIFLIILLTSTSLLIVIQISVLSLDELEISSLNKQKQSLLWQTNSCLEEVLLNIKADPYYGVGLGDFTLPIEANSCIITITANDTVRTIKAKLTYLQLYQTLQITIDTNNNIITPLTWQEN